MTQGCGEPPPMPFVENIRAGPAPACDSCPPPPICSGDSIPLFISGTLPDWCWKFRGLELFPLPLMGPLPEPPIARMTFSREICGTGGCAAATRPFQASAMMPPLPARDYSMIVELRELITCGATTARDTTFTKLVP